MGKHVLLNLNPLPANLPVASAPAAPVAAGDGFQAVMSRQFDGMPSSDGTAGEGSDFESAEPAIVVVGEVASSETPALDETDTGGVESLIGEMLQRQDVAVAEGSSLPLVDALEALANAIEHFADAATDTAADVVADVSTDVAGVAGTESPLQSLQTLFDTLAEDVAGIAAATTRTLPGLPEALPAKALAQPEQLVSTLRNLVSRLRGDETAALTGVSVAIAADQPLDPAIDAAKAVVTQPVPGLLPENATAVDAASLKTMAESLRSQVEHLAQSAQPRPVTAAAVQSTDPSLPATVLTDLSVNGQDGDLVVQETDGAAGDAEPAALPVSLDRLMREAFAVAGPQGAREPDPVVSPGQPLLDADFSLDDSGNRSLRELTLAPMAAVDPSKSTATADPRVTVAEASVVTPLVNDKAPHVESGRPAVVTGKAEVWLQQPAELPEHIVEHVNRLHAQSVRLHAAGFTDLVQRLTLSVYPEDLGQVDVQMRTGEQMNVTFFARESGTRDLLEQNLPRLRQLFESQGLSLGDVNVGAGQAQDRQAAEEGREQQARTRTGGDGSGNQGLSAAELRRTPTAGRGLIDVLA